MTGGTAETSGIPCLQVAKIIASRIYENGCDDGCELKNIKYGKE